MDLIDAKKIILSLELDLGCHKISLVSFHHVKNCISVYYGGATFFFIL